MKKNDNEQVNNSNSSFPRKWEKKLPPEIDDTKTKIDGMSDDELRKMCVKWNQAISATERDMENDSKLNSLKEDIKEAAGVYKDSISACQAQIRYAVFVLESRGK